MEGTGLAVASPVPSIARYPHVQERVGVHVITSRAPTHNIVVEVRHVIIEDAPLLALEGAGDTKVLVPHLLDRLGDGFVRVGGVVEQCEGREPLAIGITGLSKQCLRRSDVVVLVEALLGSFAEIAARKRVCNTCLLYTSDAADDLLCVDLGGRRIIKKKKQQKNNN